MDLIVTISLYFLTITAYADNNSPFNFLEASKAMVSTTRNLNKINGTYGSQSNTSCAPIRGPQGETILTCSVKDKDFDDSVILKADYDPKTMPKQLKEMLPLEFSTQTVAKNVSCIFRFSLSNDNQQMLGRTAEQEVKNATYGDDFYRTHGLGVGISCLSADGISSAYTYSTELYSDPDRMSAQRESSGNVSMKQKFTSENVFSLLQDNINQNHTTYWKRGVGFINLSEKKKWGFFQSTGQQEWFHDKINSIKRGSAYVYDDIDGKKDQWSAFVMLSVGLQQNREFGDRCKLKLNADVGGRIANIDQSTVELNTSAKLSYRIFRDGSLYLQAQDQITTRSDSTIGETTVNVGYETRNGGFIQLGVTKQRGNRNDVPDKPNIYTGENDLYISVKVGYSY